MKEEKKITGGEESKMKVERNDNWEENCKTKDEVTFFIQTDEEYDEILGKAQLVFDEKVDIQPVFRITGPCGCGKTTLAYSLSLDLGLIEDLIKKSDIPICDLTTDELKLLHKYIVDEGKDYKDFKNISNPEKEIEKYKSDESDEKDDLAHSRGEAIREIHAELFDETPKSKPIFDVTMSHATNAADLIGFPSVSDNGSTTWIDGKVTKALRSSQKDVTVLALDEVSRSPTNAKDELYDALDGRVQVSLDGGRGGEIIKGDPTNLVVVSMMNKGKGHHVERLDFAEKRRLEDTYEITFLGENYPDKEIDLIVQKTPADETLAHHMVNTANELREMYKNGDSNLSYGIPTGRLIGWANSAYSNHKIGIDNPVVKAGKSAVANAMFDHDDSEMKEVESTISKNLQDIPFEAGEDKSWRLNVVRLKCTDSKSKGCSWSSPKENAPDMAKNFYTCPECDGEVIEE